jgi:hypothetical protein
MLRRSPSIILAIRFKSVIRDQSSVCTSTHRAAACKALVWLGQQYAAYGLDRVKGAA